MRLLAIFALLLVTAATKPLPVGTPTGPWVIDMDDTYCIASHDFVVDGSMMVLGIEAVPTNGEHRLYFQVPGKLNSINDELADIFVGQTKTQYQALMSEPVVLKDHVRYSTSLQPDEYRALVDKGYIAVRSKHVEASLPLQDLKAVDAQLARCNALVLDAWGFSKAEQARLASYPKLTVSMWEIGSGEGYPESAIRRNAIGWVRVVLNVDAAGHPTQCRVVRSSGHTALDAKACQTMLERAKFSPALDHQGKPMASLFVITNRFAITD